MSLTMDDSLASLDNASVPNESNNVFFFWFGYDVRLQTEIMTLALFVMNRPDLGESKKSNHFFDQMPLRLRKVHVNIYVMNFLFKMV